MKSLAAVGLSFYEKPGHSKTLLNVKELEFLKTFTKFILMVGTVLSL